MVADTAGSSTERKREMGKRVQEARKIYDAAEAKVQTVIEDLIKVKERLAVAQQERESASKSLSKAMQEELADLK